MILMKRLFLSILLFSSFYFSNAQSHSVGLSYDYVYDAGVTRLARFDGFHVSYHHRSGSKIGLNYVYKITKSLQFNSGIQFQRNFMQSRNVITGELETRNFKIEMLNIPLFAQYTFWDFFLVEGGPLLNFQLNDYWNDRQNGLGFGLGLGIKYDIKNFSLFIKNHYQIQTLIPFNGNIYSKRIMSGNLSVGISTHL